MPIPMEAPTEISAYNRETIRLSLIEESLAIVIISRAEKLSTEKAEAANGSMEKTTIKTIRGTVNII